MPGATASVNQRRALLSTRLDSFLKEVFSNSGIISPSWAGRLLDDWCRQVMRSRVETRKKIARTHDFFWPTLFLGAQVCRPAYRRWRTGGAKLYNKPTRA